MKPNHDPWLENAHANAELLDQEIKNLRRKISAGADFILSQPIFQPETVEAFFQRYKELHGSNDGPFRLGIPLLAGILPLYSLRHATFLNNEVPGIAISTSLIERLQDAGGSAPQEGVRIALELVDQIRPWANGIYLMPQFSRYDLAAEIVEGS